MPIRFQLDENLSPAIAAFARNLGVDVTDASERGVGVSDEEQLRRAATAGRVFVTADREDFWRLSVRFAAEGLPHAGLLLLARPPRAAEFGLVARAIAAFAELYQNGVPPYFTAYLPIAQAP